MLWPITRTTHVPLVPSYHDPVPGRNAASIGGRRWAFETAPLEMKRKMNAPLEGIRVFDAGRGLARPFCSMRPGGSCAQALGAGEASAGIVAGAMVAVASVGEGACVGVKVGAGVGGVTIGFMNVLPSGAV
jgi:hypothetical protein